MRNKIFALASLLIVASMILAACATPTAETVTVVETVEVVTTVEVVKEGETVIVTATPEPAAPAKEWTSKDATVYNAAAFGEPETLDPALLYETAGGQIIQNTYDTLIFYNKENPNDFVPWLAMEVPTLENGGISADGLNVTFKVRPGVKFHDGSEMTVDDVAYSFQRGLLQGGTASPQWLLTEPFFGVGVDDIAAVVCTEAAMAECALYDDREAMKAVDPAILAKVAAMVQEKIVADAAAGTVTMKLATPWAPFIATLANSWGAIQSKAWVASKGGWDGDPATWQNFYAFSSDEVNEMGLGTGAMGTGPFKLDHWTQGEELVLVANEDYWQTEPAWEGAATGAPALKTVILKKVDEFSTRFAMFEAGDVDALAVGGPGDWPQADTLVGVECEKTTDNCQETNPDLAAMRIKGLNSTARTDMFFTFAIDNTGGNALIGSGLLDGNGIPVNFFSDPLIRKGFAYCFNYDTYLNDVLQGEAERSINIMLPGMIGSEPDGAHYTYDPAKCEENLKASMWKDNGDGTFTPDPAGTISLWDTGFRFTAAYNTGNSARQTIAEILQTELGTLNDKFVVEVTGLPWPTFLKNQRASKLPMFFSGWQEDIHDPHNWVVPYTTGTYGGRQKLPAEIKAQFAEINARAVTEVDPAKRAEIYKEFNALMYDTASVIPLYVASGRRYQQRWVQGWFWNDIFPGTYYYGMSKK